VEIVLIISRDIKIRTRNGKKNWKKIGRKRSVKKIEFISTKLCTHALSLALKRYPPSHHLYFHPRYEKKRTYKPSSSIKGDDDDDMHHDDVHGDHDDDFR
jgi:hypothetical protein